MKAHCLVFVTLVISFWGNAHAQKALDPEVKFVSAYPEGDTVRFDPTAPIDWQTLAPEPLQLLEQSIHDEVARKRILDKRDLFGYAEFPYRHELTDRVENSYLYLVASNGIWPVELKYLKGVVRFATNTNRAADTTITRIDHFGYGIGVPRNAESEWSGGFVFQTQEQINPSVENSNYTAEELTGKEQISEQEKAFWSIKKQYSFRVDQAQYIFIAWEADDACYEGCCQHRFTLYLKQDGFREVGGTYYNCDI